VQCDRPKDAFIAAFRLGDGTEVWRTARAEISTWGTPTVVAGKERAEVVTNGARAIRGYDTLKDGKESSEAIAWSMQRGGVYLPSPIVYGDQLYTVGNSGVMTAYDARTGNRVYQQRIGAGGSFSASPVAADGNLYMASEDGDIFVIKAGAQYELITKNPIGEPMIATPAWAGDVLIVRGARRLFAIAEIGR
jgi:outer membrane protein assembly factor BamB